MNSNSEEVVLSRKDRDKLRNREAILDAAAHLFAERGFNETKLEDVAELAEFGKGTLYNYFKNKNDLLVSTLEYAIEKIGRFLREKLSDVDEPLDRIRLIVRSQFDYYRENEDFLKVVTSNQAIIQKALQCGGGEQLHGKFSMLRSLMEQEIDQAIQAGIFRQGSAKKYAAYLGGMIHSQIRSLNNHEISLDQVDTDEILEIFFNGVKNA